LGGDRGVMIDNQKAADEFFKAEIRNLEAATKSAVFAGAEALKAETLKELAANFNTPKGGNRGFKKAVKAHKLPEKGVMGPVSFVRLGVPFMGIFQTGGTITGKSNLIVLLPDGQRLGFKRITAGNPWPRVWDKIKKDARLIKTPSGTVVTFKKQNGAVVPIYKIVKSVTVPKKLNFLENAEKISAEMPETIKQLMDGGNG